MGFGVHQQRLEGNLFREKPAWLTWEFCSSMWEGGLCVCVCVLRGISLPSWAKKTPKNWFLGADQFWGSLGIRVKVTECECLACLGVSAGR